MGKNLIIKGADFSANAVDHEIVEPTEYVLVGSVAPGGLATHDEGDIYYRANTRDAASNITFSNCGLTRKEGDNAVRYPVNTIFKINDVYYKSINSEGSIMQPYYGATKIDLGTLTTGGYEFVDSSTAPNEPEVSNGHIHGTVELVGGKKYVIVTVGSTSVNSVIIGNNGVYTNMSTKNNGLYFSEYMANSGDILYLTVLTTDIGSDYFVAEID